MRYILFILLILLIAFKNEDKKYSVTLTQKQWEGVLYVLDQSNAPHNDVKITSGWIVSQVQEQMKDTTIKK